MTLITRWNTNQKWLSRNLPQKLPFLRRLIATRSLRNNFFFLFSAKQKRRWARKNDATQMCAYWTNKDYFKSPFISVCVCVSVATRKFRRGRTSRHRFLRRFQSFSTYVVCETHRVLQPFSCCGFRDWCNCPLRVKPFGLDITNCFGNYRD